jgi:hypothetical protein
LRTGKILLADDVKKITSRISGRLKIVIEEEMFSIVLGVLTVNCPVLAFELFPIKRINQIVPSHSDSWQLFLANI